MAEKKGVDAYVQTTNTVVFAFSQLKGSAAYHFTVLEVFVHVQKYGTVPAGSLVEVFYDGKRLPRADGIPYDTPLPDGLVDLPLAEACGIDPT